MTADVSHKIPLGFIGLGVMGRSMASHLLAAGHPLTVFNRSRDKAAPLLAAGAVWADHPAAVAAASEVVLTMVGFPPDVEEVYFGTNGLLSALRPGQITIDCTTTDPTLAERIATAAKRIGAEALDAPVSGGDLGAREARLSIMVGGHRATFDKVLPLLELLGKNIVWQGPAGSGQRTKLCNQIVISGTVAGVCEALAFAEKSGLNPASVLQSISGGAAGSWTLTNLAPRILAGDFAPGFFVKHFIKDMNLALGSARAMNLELPALELVLARYRELAAQGGGDLGTQALYRLYSEERP